MFFLRLFVGVGPPMGVPGDEVSEGWGLGVAAPPLITPRGGVGGVR